MNYIKILGLSGLFMCFVMFYVIFFVTAYNGGFLAIDINRYYEMGPEVFVLLVFFPFIVLYLRSEYKGLNKSDLGG